VQRFRRHPFLSLFDGADPNTTTARRGVSTVAAQALWFLNSPWVAERAAGLAQRLEPITDESERLTRLIDNVLEFSRLEKGQREAKLAAGALEPVLRESIEKLRPHAKREGFELRVEIEAGLPPVRFDRDAFVQVIFNLLDNAIKYASSSGTREVVIECLRADEGVEVRVRDFGPGVPAEQLSRIFEPFYRCGDELTRTTKGSGIGLALVKELAESMGATVRGSNAEGGGFRVSIAFPAEEPA